eukprot:6197988-Pleurochrysis_carterae.AAC.4
MSRFERRQTAKLDLRLQQESLEGRVLESDVRVRGKHADDARFPFRHDGSRLWDRSFYQPAMRKGRARRIVRAQRASPRELNIKGRPAHARVWMCVCMRSSARVPRCVCTCACILDGVSVLEYERAHVCFLLCMHA